MDDPDPELEVEIQIREFSGWFGGEQVLADVTLPVFRRQITACIGATGCGKSTLLRWINRMHDVVPEARATGTLRLGKMDVLAPTTDVHELRRTVGMVTPQPTPFPQSIYDNVAFGPRLAFRFAQDELDELVEAALVRVRLWDEVRDRLRASPNTLSLGQQQRLCLARAVANEPRVLLLDEPSAELDPNATALLEDLVGDLRKDYTILLVTHNMQQAARLSDFCAFFQRGELIEFGPTLQIFSRPEQSATERYITGRF